MTRLILASALLLSLLWPVSGWAGTIGLTDPTGTSLQNSSGNPIGIKFTAPGTAGTITKMTVYLRDAINTSHSVGVALYVDSAGTPNGAKLAQGSATTTVSTNTPAWYDVPISYAFSANQILWLCFWGSTTNLDYYLIAGAANQLAYGWTGTWETWPDPGNSANYIAYSAAVYATYTDPSGVLQSPSTGALIGVIH